MYYNFRWNRRRVLTFYVKNHTRSAGLARVPQRKSFRTKVRREKWNHIYLRFLFPYVLWFLVKYPKGADLPELLHCAYSYTCTTPCRYVRLYQFIPRRVSEEWKHFGPLWEPQIIASLHFFTNNSSDNSRSSWSLKII